ncbi:TetR/AcrR family transcriptional regulator [Nitrospirillum sp. BR 11164]|uniref:TetR/AcrR family transcriptional regulator n=1 Tax=Nitrospirillum sp. BR 11164 TaxID=3104324 RepID=UPI002AFFBA6C|nr:TetR/AcrR family transcriptional regulator [Nitrospirillum sp. BR 11164]MEA1652223.1 TetR/AcrR family transcriptional regulator [Nitrospirillum sp. BR 11164]
MVQIKDGMEAKRRGRPRAYDPHAALLRAMDAFWKSGYSGTSLDDLSAATGMNRPSLYAAFGDKRSLYLKALAHYWQVALDGMRADLALDRPLADSLMRAYEGALAIYFSDTPSTDGSPGDGPARGCFVVGTAVTEAVEDAEIRESLMTGFLAFDADFAARFRAAQKTGELRGDADPSALAVIATGVMHTIAIRARSGATRGDLEELARKAVRALCR